MDPTSGTERPSLKPSLVFRVGVSGTRKIDPENLAALREQIDANLRLIRDEVSRLANHPVAREIYAGTIGEGGMDTRIVSPLAEGADRLVAEAGLAMGYTLSAPLPFAQNLYENDFPATVDSFRALLAQGKCLELDGDREDPGASYEAVGRFVIRNCDLLIAVWDGTPSRGRGGTAEIIRFAASCHMPIVWIDPNLGEMRFITSMAGLRHRANATTGQAITDEIRTYIARLLLPPRGAAPHLRGALGWLASLRRGTPSNPVLDYLNEAAPTPPRGIWSAYSAFINFLAPARPSDQALAPVKIPAPKESFWARHRANSDELSQFYANKYRSSYVIIFFIALTAVVFSVVGPGFGDRIKVSGELVFVCCVVSIAWANHVKQWHGRWIAYRLLAEVCRKQEILAPLGRSLPSFVIENIDLPEDDREDEASETAGNWVGWFFHALQRGAPPIDDLDGQLPKHHALDLARELIVEQRTYHSARWQRTATADRRLAIGDLLVAVAAWLLALCLIILLTGVSDVVAKWIEDIATILSAASITLVGLRSYSEFSLLARESHRMRKLLSNVEKDLDSINIDAPLASVELGFLSYQLSILMMHEIDGWAQLFRLRTVEIN